MSLHKVSITGTLGGEILAISEEWDPLKPCILITGVTGNVGRHVAAELMEDGMRVRGAVTDVEKAQGSFGGPIELVHLDYEDEDTFDKALRNANKVFMLRPYSISASSVMKPFIRRCAEAGIEHIVFLSFMGVERNPLLPHYRIERNIKKSGIPYTFLRPSFFMQNFHTIHRADIKARNDIFIPAGNASVSFIDARDIGRAAAKVLLSEEYKNRALTLTGPEAITFDAAAHIFSQVMERPHSYSKPTALQFKRRMLWRGIPNHVVRVMVSLYRMGRRGAASKVTGDLEALLQQKPTTLEQYVRDHRQEWELI
jgi:uncharacterized protein YbjT (DUF2867 family)